MLLSRRPLAAPLAVMAALCVGFAALSALAQADVWSGECPGQIWQTCKGRTLDIEAPAFVAALISAAALAVAVAALRRFGASDIAAQGGEIRFGRPALALFVALGAVATAMFCLGGFANSGDEGSYLFEARALTHGRLWEPAPPLGEAMIPWRTWIAGERWISQYPPGWPAALALALLAGLPGWAANVALGVVCTWLVELLLRRWLAPAASLTLAFALAASPFYLFNAASLFPHMLSATLIVALCRLLIDEEAAPSLWRPAAAGLLLGLIGLTRYFTLALLIPPLAFWALGQPLPRWPRLIAAAALGIAPPAAALLASQYLLTGNPFASTYSLISVQDAALSLAPADLAYGWQLTIARLAELMLWTSPLFVAAYVAAFIAKARARRLAFYDLIFPCFVAGFVAFAQLGVNRYGPRYYFDAYPAMALTLGSAWPLLGEAARAARRPWIVAGAALSLAFTASTWPLAAAGFRHEVAERQEPYRLAAALGLDRAIVILQTPSGRGLAPSDLVRNPTDMNAPLLYARAGTSPAALRAAFPGRTIWTYARPDFLKPGRIEPATGSD